MNMQAPYGDDVESSPVAQGSPAGPTLDSLSQPEPPPPVTAEQLHGAELKPKIGCFSKFFNFMIVSLDAVGDRQKMNPAVHPKTLMGAFVSSALRLVVFGLIIYAIVQLASNERQFTSGATVKLSAPAWPDDVMEGEELDCNRAHRQIGRVDFPALDLEVTMDLSFYETTFPTVQRIDWKDNNGYMPLYCSDSEEVHAATGASIAKQISLGNADDALLRWTGGTHHSSASVRLSELLRQSVVSGSLNTYEAEFYSNEGMTSATYPHDLLAVVAFDHQEIQSLKRCQLQAALVGGGLYDALFINDWVNGLRVNYSKHWTEIDSRNLVFSSSDLMGIDFLDGKPEQAYGNLLVLHGGINSEMLQSLASEYGNLTDTSDWVLLLSYQNNIAHVAEDYMCDGDRPLYGDSTLDIEIPIQAVGTWNMSMASASVPLPFAFYYNRVGNGSDIRRDQLTSALQSGRNQVLCGSSICETVSERFSDRVVFQIIFQPVWETGDKTIYDIVGWDPSSLTLSVSPLSAEARLALVSQILIGQNSSACFEATSFEDFPEGSPPSMWTCSVSRWRDYYCDCNCGFFDPDCCGQENRVDLSCYPDGTAYEFGPNDYGFDSEVASDPSYYMSLPCFSIVPSGTTVLEGCFGPEEWCGFCSACAGDSSFLDNPGFEMKNQVLSSKIEPVCYPSISAYVDTSSFFGDMSSRDVDPYSFSWNTFSQNMEVVFEHPSPDLAFPHDPAFDCAAECNITHPREPMFGLKAYNFAEIDCEAWANSLKTHSTQSLYVICHPLDNPQNALLGFVGTVVKGTPILPSWPLVVKYASDLDGTSPDVADPLLMWGTTPKTLHFRMLLPPDFSPYNVSEVLDIPFSATRNSASYTNWDSPMHTYALFDTTDLEHVILNDVQENAWQEAQVLGINTLAPPYETISEIEISLCYPPFLKDGDINELRFERSVATFYAAYPATELSWESGVLVCDVVAGRRMTFWNCPRELYYDGVCHLNCGMLDPDCADIFLTGPVKFINHDYDPPLDILYSSCINGNCTCLDRWLCDLNGPYPADNGLATATPMPPGIPVFVRPTLERIYVSNCTDGNRLLDPSFLVDNYEHLGLDLLLLKSEYNDILLDGVPVFAITSYWPVTLRRASTAVSYAPSSRYLGHYFDRDDPDIPLREWEKNERSSSPSSLNLDIAMFVIPHRKDYEQLSLAPIESHPAPPHVRMLIDGWEYHPSRIPYIYNSTDFSNCSCSATNCTDDPELCYWEGTPQWMCPAKTMTVTQRIPLTQRWKYQEVDPLADTPENVIDMTTIFYFSFGEEVVKVDHDFATRIDNGAFDITSGEAFWYTGALSFRGIPATADGKPAVHFQQINGLEASYKVAAALPRLRLSARILPDLKATEDALECVRPKAWRSVLNDPEKLKDFLFGESKDEFEDHIQSTFPIKFIRWDFTAIGGYKKLQEIFLEPGYEITLQANLKINPVYSVGILLAWDIEGWEVVIESTSISTARLSYFERNLAKLRVVVELRDDATVMLIQSQYTYVNFISDVGSAIAYMGMSALVMMYYWKVIILMKNRALNLGKRLQGKVRDVM